MTDSLPPSQQRPPDGDEANAESDWGTSAPIDEAAAHDGDIDRHDEQPGFPDGPTGPAEGGD